VCKKEGRKEGAGELTRNGKEHDLLVGPFFRCVVIHWDAAGGDAGLFFGVWHVAVVWVGQGGQRDVCMYQSLCSGEWGA
jgi:hypothetical protein